MVVVGSKILKTKKSVPTPYVDTAQTLLTSIPQEKGKRWNLQTCTEVRKLPELATLPEGAHTASPLPRHAAEQGVPINLPRGLGKEKK